MTSANDQIRQRVVLEQNILNSETARQRHEIICAGLKGGIAPNTIKAFAEELYPDRQVDEQAIAHDYATYSPHMHGLSNLGSFDHEVAGQYRG